MGKHNEYFVVPRDEWQMGCRVATRGASAGAVEKNSARSN